MTREHFAYTRELAANFHLCGHSQALILLRSLLIIADDKIGLVYLLFVCPA